MKAVTQRAPSPGVDGGVHEVRSPIDGAPLACLRLPDAEELGRTIAAFVARTAPLGTAAALALLERVGERLSRRRSELIEVTLRETGFVLEDSRETVDGVLEFLASFRRHVAGREVAPQRVPHSYLRQTERGMTIEHRPFRCVAVLVPQNASFNLALTVIAAALDAGARVIVRPSLQCTASALVLQEVLAECAGDGAPVAIVHGMACDFLRACFASPEVDLVHYIGSNAYAESVLRESVAARKTCLIDGQGNGLLYVDSSFPLDEAVRIVTAGATRFNGETCTSVNGVLVDARVHDELRTRLVARFRTLRVGHPADPATEVGPLFSPRQARDLADTLAQGRILCGADVDGSYFTPAIVEGLAPESALVREGFLGPAMWLQPVEERDMLRWIRANAFPLSDAILSHREELVQAFARGSSAARITVNADPSIESMFEPWGGYPPSGWNPVSLWSDKYRQAFQLDRHGPASGAA